MKMLKSLLSKNLKEYLDVKSFELLVEKQDWYKTESKNVTITMYKKNSVLHGDKEEVMNATLWLPEKDLAKELQFEISKEDIRKYDIEVQDKDTGEILYENICLTTEPAYVDSCLNDEIRELHKRAAKEEFKQIEKEQMELNPDGLSFLFEEDFIF